VKLVLLTFVLSVSRNTGASVREKVSMVKTSLLSQPIITCSIWLLEYAYHMYLYTVD